MALSRLRLRLALSYSLAFTVGLLLLAAVALGYLWRESHQRLDAHLRSVATDVRRNVEMELAETPDSGFAFIAREVVSEWPRNGGSFLICDRAGAPLAATDSSAFSDDMATRCRTGSPERFVVAAVREGSYEAVARRATLPSPPGAPSRVTHDFGIVAFASTAGISEDVEALVVALAIAVPIILLVSLTGGYLMAGRALRPVTDLGAAIAGMAPSDVANPLPVQEPHDEVGTLAAEFNGLLARLHAAQRRNRRFLREAAHQIRTPLTLVLGEASYELQSAPPDPVRMQASLTRISAAAERMRRRVDDLMLLAEAQTGEPVTMTDAIELDGLVLESVDLMRPRSTGLGRRLAIGTADNITTKGNKSLLQEAVLELLENALRHGTPDEPVVLSAFEHEGSHVVEVASTGAAFELPPRAEDPGPERLGLPIVRWVAEVHGGRLTLHRDQQGNVFRNVLRIVIPAVAPSPREM